MRSLAHVLASTLPAEAEAGGPDVGVRVSAVEFAIELPVRVVLIDGHLRAVTTRRLRTGFDAPPIRVRATFVRGEP